MVTVRKSGFSLSLHVSRCWRGCTVRLYGSTSGQNAAAQCSHSQPPYLLIYETFNIYFTCTKKLLGCNNNTNTRFIAYGLDRSWTVLTFGYKLWPILMGGKIEQACLSFTDLLFEEHNLICLCWDAIMTLFCVATRSHWVALTRILAPTGEEDDKRFYEAPLWPWSIFSSLALWPRAWSRGELPTSPFLYLQRKTHERNSVQAKQRLLID